jgi:sugar transferase (PEP-CTERM/EpsH1 system associated)
MRILFLTPQLPYPPQKGTALRNWGLISELATRHDVAVLSFLDPGQPPHVAEKLAAAATVEALAPPARSLRDRLRDMLTTRLPDMALRLAAPAYSRRLEEWLSRVPFDAVHVEGIEMAPYLDVLERAQPRPLIVFDDHNCEYLLQKRALRTDLGIPTRWPAAAYSFVQWRRLRRYEAQACRRSDRVLAVSAADAAALRELVPDLPVTVVPNGIDTTTYKPTEQAGETEPRTLVFTGTMDFRPNVDAVLWFARQVLPRVREQAPEARFLIVGQRPHRRLDELRADPAITLTGRVDDVRPYIARAAAYVAPLRIGGGTRLKLLEAMAMGKAIVSTRLGAEGYPVSDGQQLMLADAPDEFAAAVVDLLREPRRREALGQTARAFVERKYDWRAIVPIVEAAYALSPAK